MADVQRINPTRLVRVGKLVGRIVVAQHRQGLVALHHLGDVDGIAGPLLVLVGQDLGRIVVGKRRQGLVVLHHIGDVDGLGGACTVNVGKAVGGGIVAHVAARVLHDRLEDLLHLGIVHNVLEVVLHIAHHVDHRTWAGNVAVLVDILLVIIGVLARIFPINYLGNHLGHRLVALHHIGDVDGLGGACTVNVGKAVGGGIVAHVAARVLHDRLEDLLHLGIVHNVLEVVLHIAHHVDHRTWAGNVAVLVDILLVIIGVLARIFPINYLGNHLGHRLVALHHIGDVDGLGGACTVNVGKAVGGGIVAHVAARVLNNGLEDLLHLGIVYNVLEVVLHVAHHIDIDRFTLFIGIGILALPFVLKGRFRLVVLHHVTDVDRLGSASSIYISKVLVCGVVAHITTSVLHNGLEDLLHCRVAYNILEVVNYIAHHVNYRTRTDNVAILIYFFFVIVGVFTRIFSVKHLCYNLGYCLRSFYNTININGHGIARTIYIRNDMCSRIIFDAGGFSFASQEPLGTVVIVNTRYHIINGSSVVGNHPRSMRRQWRCRSS